MITFPFYHQIYFRLSSSYLFLFIYLLIFYFRKFIGRIRFFKCFFINFTSRHVTVKEVFLFWNYGNNRFSDSIIVVAYDCFNLKFQFEISFKKKQNLLILYWFGRENRQENFRQNSAHRLYGLGGHSYTIGLWWVFSVGFYIEIYWFDSFEWSTTRGWWWK